MVQLGILFKLLEVGEPDGLLHHVPEVNDVVYHLFSEVHVAGEELNELPQVIVRAEVEDAVVLQFGLWVHGGPEQSAFAMLVDVLLLFVLVLLIIRRVVLLGLAGSFGFRLGCLLRLGWLWLFLFFFRFFLDLF